MDTAKVGDKIRWKPSLFEGFSMAETIKFTLNSPFREGILLNSLAEVIGVVPPYNIKIRWLMGIRRERIEEHYPEDFVKDISRVNEYGHGR